MLRRHRQLRNKVHRLIDLALFVVAFLIAHWVRDAVPLSHYVGWVPGIGDLLVRKLTDVIYPFHQYFWIYLIIVPLVPIVLEGQGFYQRPLLFSRRQTAWP